MTPAAFLCATVGLFCPPAQSLGVAPTFEMHMVSGGNHEIFPRSFDSADSCEIMRLHVQSEMEKAAKLNQITAAPETSCRAVRK